MRKCMLRTSSYVLKDAHKLVSKSSHFYRKAFPPRQHVYLCAIPNPTILNARMRSPAAHQSPPSHTPNGFDHPNREHPKEGRSFPKRPAFRVSGTMMEKRDAQRLDTILCNQLHRMVVEYPRGPAVRFNVALASSRASPPASADGRGCRTGQSHESRAPRSS